MDTKSEVDVTGTSSSPTNASEVPTQLTWVIRSAIAGTIGSTISAIVSFVLFILLRPTFNIVGRDQTQIAAALMRDVMLHALRDGLCWGLFLGISFAGAWEALIERRARTPTHWIPITIMSTVIGITVAYMGISINGWWSYRSTLTTAIGGACAGLIIGTMQSAILWAQRGARVRWVLAQTLSFACIMTLMTYANREIGSFFLFPLVWLGMWGLYGGFIGYIFAEIQDHSPAEAE